MKREHKQPICSRLSERDSTVTPRLQEAFVRFLEYHPARRFSTNLRTWLLEFLMYDGSSEAEYMRHLVTDLEGLFDLLDVVEEEWHSGVAAQPQVKSFLIPS